MTTSINPLVHSLGQSALNLALTTLPLHEIATVAAYYYEHKGMFSSDDLIKRLALDLKQYQLDKKRQNHEQLLAEKTINYCKALLPTE